MNTRADIQGFLSLRRIAVVGVSRNAKDFTRSLFREFRDRGYQLYPVNPNCQEVEGCPCLSSIKELPPGIEGALLLTPAAKTAGVVRDCVEAGIGAIWMYRAGGAGAVDPEAAQWCRSQGIPVIAGECPFMFFAKTGWLHRAHGFCRKISGTYPS
jgi:predicted CoA-binding protein